MGFDLYGSNPQYYEGKEFPIYTKYKDMDWEDRDVHVDWEKDKDKFWEEEHKLDRATGNYRIDIGLLVLFILWPFISMPFTKYLFIIIHYLLRLIPIDTATPCGIANSVADSIA